MLNQARLKVLKAREDHIQTVLTEARQSLVSIAKDQQKYPKILEGLIAQVCVCVSPVIYVLFIYLSRDSQSGYREEVPGEPPNCLFVGALVKRCLK
jgi:vacuolar-type H+-ATPase subunit E/Vma4